MIVDCPISLGEFIDKMTILEIKSEKIKDSGKLLHVKKELSALEEKLAQLGIAESIGSLRDELKAVNLNLWEIEDDIRVKEKAREFDEKFIELARAVYVTNDKRFSIKNMINQKLSSGFVEVKSYEDYA